MAIATTYNTAGNREDLSDIISLISPQDTPVYSTIKKVKATGIYHEWQMDKLLPINKKATVEGDDVSVFDNMSKQRARTGTHIQQIRRPYHVSKQQQLVLTAGVANEFDRQKMLAAENLLRDIESVICGSQDDGTDNGVTGYQTRGLDSWISSSAQSTNPVPAAFLTPAGSIVTGGASITEAAFKGVIQSVYQQAGNKGLNYRLIAGPTLRAQISLFLKTGGAAYSGSAASNSLVRSQQDGKSKQLFEGVDLYHSDFGIVTIEPSLFLARNDGTQYTDDAATSGPKGFLIRDDLLELAYLQDVMSEELPDMGGGRRGYVDVLCGLVCLNPLGFGKISA